MCHKETKEILNANDLLALMETDLDKDALKKCTEEFNANGLPKYEEKDEPETEAKESEQKEYGWLSPEGDFHSAEWGCHEMAAQPGAWYRQWISDVQRYPCRAWMVPY